MMNEAEDCTCQKAFLVLLLAHTQFWEAVLQQKLLYTIKHFSAYNSLMFIFRVVFPLFLQGGDIKPSS